MFLMMNQPFSSKRWWVCELNWLMCFWQIILIIHVFVTLETSQGLPFVLEIQSYISKHVKEVLTGRRWDIGKMTITSFTCLDNTPYFTCVDCNNLCPNYSKTNFPWYGLAICVHISKYHVWDNFHWTSQHHIRPFLGFLARIQLLLFCAVLGLTLGIGI